MTRIPASFRRFALTLVSAVLMTLTTTITSALSLTIEDATNLALEHNESYLMARAELDKADAEVKNAVAGALPHVDLTGSYTRNFEIQEIVFGGQTFRLGTTNNFNVGLELNQPIWLGGKVFAAVKIARLYRQYVGAMVKETEGQVLFGVRQAFLRAILAEDYVQVYREAVATAELNLEMVQKMYDQGVVSEYERLRAEVELANLRPQLIQAENQAEIASHNLKNMIGLNLSDELELEYDFNPDWSSQQLNLKHLSSLTGENRPSLQESDYYVEMRKKAIGIAKAGYRPQISLQSNLDWTRQSDEFDLSTSDWTRSISASLRISMPIFDGFATSAEVKKAKLDHVSSTLEASSIQNQVELELQAAFLTYQETSERLSAMSKTVAQAEEGLRIARLRYEQGVGTQLEVLSAEAALTLAKTNYVQVTHDAAVAVYRLLQVTGVDNVDELREQ